MGHFFWGGVFCRTVFILDFNSRNKWNYHYLFRYMKHQGQCLPSGFNDSGLNQQFFNVLLATIVGIFRSKMIYVDHRQPSRDWLGSYIYSYGICCLLTADWTLDKLISNWCSLVRAGLYETSERNRNRGGRKQISLSLFSEWSWWLIFAQLLR